jgi:hypothetical protein
VQRRVDAEQVRQPLELVPVERADLALLPLVERGAGDAEQRRLLGDAELPGLGQAKEGAQARQPRPAPCSCRRRPGRACAGRSSAEERTARRAWPDVVRLRTKIN